MEREGVIQAIQAIEDEQIVSDCNDLSIKFSFATNEDDGEPEVDITIYRRVMTERGHYEEQEIGGDIALESFAAAIARAAELLKDAARA
jgi:hypothetical protein